LCQCRYFSRGVITSEDTIIDADQGWCACIFVGPNLLAWVIAAASVDCAGLPECRIDRANSCAQTIHTSPASSVRMTFHLRGTGGHPSLLRCSPETKPNIRDLRKNNMGTRVGSVGLIDVGIDGFLCRIMRRNQVRTAQTCQVPPFRRDLRCSPSGRCTRFGSQTMCHGSRGANTLAHICLAGFE